MLNHEPLRFLYRLALVICSIFVIFFFIGEMNPTMGFLAGSIGELLLIAFGLCFSFCGFIAMRHIKHRCKIQLYTNDNRYETIELVSGQV
ncbi:MAG: hypothetical protein RR232_03275 [Clostridia bacterium]